MINRVDPTENAIRDRAPKVVASWARTRCGVREEKTWAMPNKGRPDGPGMGENRALDRAQESPPGWRSKAKMERQKRREKKRENERMGGRRREKAVRSAEEDIFDVFKRR